MPEEVLGGGETDAGQGPRPVLVIDDEVLMRDDEPIHRGPFLMALEVQVRLAEQPISELLRVQDPLGRASQAPCLVACRVREHLLPGIHP